MEMCAGNVEQIFQGLFLFFLFFGPCEVKINLCVIFATVKQGAVRVGSTYVDKHTFSWDFVGFICDVVCAFTNADINFHTVTVVLLLRLLTINLLYTFILNLTLTFLAR